ncbi:MAG TPA: L,D-transpeptidase [Candidatus Dormibacteraeota bacterium]
MTAALAIGLGGSDAFAYQARSDALRATIDRYQQQGVPAPLLDPIRAQLAARRQPANALLANPFADLEAAAQDAFRFALASSRDHAALELTTWEVAEGGAPETFAGDRLALVKGSTPAELDDLAYLWQIRAEAAQLERETLATEAGGYQDGRPQDIANLAAALEAGAAAAASVQVVDTPATELRARIFRYVSLGISDQLAEYDDFRAALQAGVDQLNHRVDEKNQVNELVAGLDDLFAAASTIAIPTGMPEQIAKARADAAIAANDEQVGAALMELQTITNSLRDIAYPHPGGALPPCIAGGAGQLIAIHLVTQQLIAYQDGCPWLATPVTTGRPALPTDRGTFRIFYKAYAYKMVSPWPKGSPFWYPDAWVYDAMEFVGDGTFIHNADWQPDDSYGPGSQYGPYASHGCVHVKDEPLSKLFAWTQVGATVVVGD